MHAADAHLPLPPLTLAEGRRTTLPDRRRTAGLLGYGALVGAVAVAWLASAVPDDAAFMQSRVDDIASSIAVLERGGPPLLGSATGYEGTDVDPRRDFRAVGDLPSPGVYLYFPLVAQLTGTDDPRLILKWFFIGMAALLLAVFPLMLYQLMGSVAAALAAPLLVATQFRFVVDTDVYWVSAWTILLCLPLLAIRILRDSPLSFAFLIGLAAIAGFATSVRVGAGLPVLVALAAAAAVKCRGRRVLSVLVVVLVYLVVSSWMFRGVEAYRNNVVGFEVSRQEPSLWHSVYLGFGYSDNPYGIAYDDNVGLEHARRIDPDLAYFQRDYGDVVRSMVFDIAREDPQFVLRSLMSKLAAVVIEAVGRFWPAMVALPFALFTGIRRLRISIALVAPALLIGLVPPIVVMPYTQYAMTWLAGWGFLWVILAAWAIAQLARTPPRTYANWVRGRAPDWLSVRALRTAGVALLAVFAFVTTATTRLVASGVAAVTERADTESFYRTRQAQLLSAVPPAAQPLARWDISGGLPTSWLSLGATVAPGGRDALVVATTQGRFDYQLQGPAYDLGPGEYVLVVAGRPVAGGIQLGVLDADAFRWVATTNFWHHQGSFPSRLMSTQFRLERSTRVQAVLSNWRHRPGRSEWSLRHVTLYRLQPPRIG